MNTPSRARVALCWSIAAAFAGTSPLIAQSSGSHSHGSHKSTAGSSATPTAAESHAVHEAMSRAMDANPHIRLSPRRTATVSDSARAARLVDEARVALAKYKDVRVAEREGYKPFAPNVKQPVYHFTSMGAAIREQFRLDVTRPSSLLYKDNGDGSVTLVGAMYSAPRNATWDDLDERVPLGMTRWHLHTNMCIPRFRELERWKELENGKPVFGPLSPIATREACDAVDGRFLPVVFNWMVHVNMFEADVWGGHH